MNKVTLKVIAEKLGVSISTVSRALTGKPGVSKGLRDKIIATAKNLGYYPDVTATGLRRGKTMTIGVLLPELSGDFFSQIVTGMEKVLFHLGYRLMLCPTDDDPEKEAAQIKMLLSQKVEGILSAPADMKANRSLYSQVINDMGIPIVFFDRLVEGVDTDYVLTDNEDGIRQLVDYLMSKGHRRIGMIHPLRGTFTGEARLRAFLEYKDRIEIKEEWVKDGKSSEVGGYEAFKSLIREKDKPTALIVGNNLMMLGVLKAVRDLSVKIPDDISLVSFDDAYWNEIFDPPITCVAQDPHQIGLITATILLDKMKNKKEKGKRTSVVLKVRFIERSSVRKVKG